MVIDVIEWHHIVYLITW